MAISQKARIDFKLLEEQKELFKRAAEYSGKSLSEFLISSAEEKAHQVVEEHERILSSERDREIFFNALMNPPEPSQRLKAAAARFLSNMDK